MLANMPASHNVACMQAVACLQPCHVLWLACKLATWRAGKLVTWRAGVVALFKEMDISSLDIADFLAIGAIFSATDSVCTLQLLDLSGILTVFFYGIVMSHYTWHNVTESSRITTKHAFATLSSLLKHFFFLYVGMDALDIEKWRFVSGSVKHFSNMPSDPSTRKALLWQLIENGHGLEGEVGEHIAQPPTEDSFFRL
ncbi:hypothetical protein ZIOFF_008659 [Zingiber officinale]|uniref:Cation/H+ exchanger transmembrane domain-containing protein n=1 Tax=Zingiber officinale TaxID=94328 RepID=A0A8J5I6W8_ZINOF|nr:hypothetical protein ZIOFF_008659 [Zingiber officinale]